MSKSRRIAAWVLIVLVGVPLILSAAAKLAGAEPVVEQFAKWNLKGWLLPIGVIELTSAVLLLIPRTHSLGLLLVSAYLGGAIATHLQQQDALGAVSPAVMLAMLWIGGLLMHPELLVSFRRSRSAA